MHRRRWRFYETASGAKPVQAFLDNLTAAEAAEVVAAMKEVARERGFTALVANAEVRLAFGRRMAERRRANGKTQTQVAALMHTSPAIVSRLESGHDVRVSTLEKYVAALGLRLEINAMPPKKPTTKASRTRRTKK